jgi:hypothetical protein
VEVPTYRELEFLYGRRRATARALEEAGANLPASAV